MLNRDRTEISRLRVLRVGPAWIILLMYITRRRLIESRPDLTVNDGAP